jgi:hypothetical protein
MERLEKKSPSASLTDAQKQALAEIDATYRARLAEKELFLKDLLVRAQTAGKADEVAELQDQLRRELRRINEDWESKKQKAREAL